jgi:hypothetical protein
MYAIEIDSDAMIYIPNFIKIGSDIKKIWRSDNHAHTHTHTHTYTQQVDL